jgi:hypothetical protein
MRAFPSKIVFVLVTVALACSKAEQPAGSSGSPVSRQAAPSREESRGSPRNPEALRGTEYETALDWLRTTKGFHFVLDDAGMHAEGDMVRPAIGLERVRMTIGGTEWLAASGTQGVTWHRREGNQWKPANEPENGGRLYQRVTVAFDPQKKEGSAQDSGGGVYRFTNANTGEVHNVGVTGGRITAITIGDAMKMVITRHDVQGDVPQL